MKPSVFFLIIVSAIALPAVTATADANQKKVYTTKMVNPHSPTIDGRGDDPCWQGVEWGQDFTQLKPYEGKAPTQPTRFKIMYDEKNLYVLIQALDGEPGKIDRRASRRDDVDGDRVQVLIDSYLDRRTAFCFMVNAAGVKGDSTISNDGNSEDNSWDPLWDVKTSVSAEGWTAEMRIPFSQLRFASGENKVWGLQVTRDLYRNQERSGWQFIPSDASGLVHLFGELQGFLHINAQHQKEILPYVVAKTQRSPGQSGNPFDTGTANRLTGGVDGKIGLTSDLTLDFTLNPDFGQVEADPSVINLTGFETYYQEKRPFFIEGKNILDYRLMLGDGDFSMDSLFYTRRIGRTPHSYPDLGADEYADVPINTTILGAMKVTGKTRNGFSLGILDALTAKENAEIDLLGQRRQEAVEPLTNYFTLRAQQDFNQGASMLGGMVTATNRDIHDSSLDFLHTAAYSGGLDFLHTWQKQTFYIRGNFAFSLVRGSPQAIDNTQRSSVHYFQRPDADYVRYDPTRTSLSGNGGMLCFGKNGSGQQRASLQYMLGVTWRSPGLELNDMGYLHYADVIMQWVWANYGIHKPFSIFRDISFNFNQWLGWDYGGERTFAGGNFGINADLKNYWQFSLGSNRQGEGLSNSKLRGGPAMKVVGGWNPWISVGSDSRKPLTLQGNFSAFIGDGNFSRDADFSLGVTFRPSRAISLTLMPEYYQGHNQLQYVATASQEGDNRYIIGNIRQKTLGITIRLNWSLSPDLSIQFYGQPFIASGAYTAFKQVTSPRANQVRDRFYAFAAGDISFDAASGLYQVDRNHDGVADYTFANPDFNVLEFRSNLVLRWEYRPGAILYLVWSQGRADYPAVLSPGIFNRLDDLLRLPATNVFLLKFSYNFNL